MGIQEEQDSPLADAAGAAGPHTVEAFQLLANETRMAILLALWEAKEPTSDAEDAVPFSELYDRIDIDDSGNFNYHLEKLEGHFVAATDEGYELEPAGTKIVRAVIAGTGISEPTLEPTEVDMTCPLCEAPTKITYREGRLCQVCTECDGILPDNEKYPPGTLFSWRLDPPGLENRTPEEVYAATTIGMKRRIVGMVDGVCSACSGPVKSKLDVCEDHRVDSDGKCSNCGRPYEVEAIYNCLVCKNAFGAPPSAVVVQHPAVISFYHDHGIDYQFNPSFDDMTNLLEIVQGHEQELVSTSPSEVLVTVQYAGDELNLTLNDEMCVVDVSM